MILVGRRKTLGFNVSFFDGFLRKSEEVMNVACCTSAAAVKLFKFFGIYEFFSSISFGYALYRNCW
jgi:hypothetical protein